MFLNSGVILCSFRQRICSKGEYSIGSAFFMVYQFLVGVPGLCKLTPWFNAPWQHFGRLARFALLRVVTKVMTNTKSNAQLKPARCYAFNKDTEVRITTRHSVSTSFEGHNKITMAQKQRDVQRLASTYNQPVRHRLGKRHFREDCRWERWRRTQEH